MPARCFHSPVFDCCCSLDVAAAIHDTENGIGTAEIQTDNIRFQDSSVMISFIFVN